jgi:hypothetical protein
MELETILIIEYNKKERPIKLLNKEDRSHRESIECSDGI